MHTDYKTDVTIHELFEQCVDCTPDKIAVVDEQQTLSYTELNERANQLAEFLILKGVCQDMPVGICVDRTIIIAIAILGVLKAGGAYIPLDPHSPELRLQKIIMDSGVKFILSEQALQDKFSNYSGQLVLVDTNDEFKHLKKTNPSILVSPNNLAYIIYTSGSTGEPKGVAMEHKPLVNLCLWHKNALQDSGLKTLGFSSFIFDVSTQEFFSTCCTSGTYYIASENQRLFPERLAKYIQKNGIERIFMPFTPLQYFITNIWEERIELKCLKSIITAGEPLIISKVFREFFSQHIHCELRNQYGLTEVHTMTDYKLQGSPNDWPECPPIGRPITNTCAYILDEKLQPVSQAEQGEIYVGGVCPARGYLNRSDLTKEKFLPDPFSTVKDARMYRTGDLGKLLPDGNIQNLGRQDNQVKIRGFRIELDEIQIVLLQHPGVKHAVAIALESEHAGKQLVAYVVCNQGKVPSIFEFRSYLAERLPDYMVPHSFVILDMLPQTISGKLDRKSLPPPGKPVSQTSFVAPKNELESKLLSTWEEVLSINKLGIRDDFFVLGGDSILAAQLLLNIEKIFEIEISMENIYNAPCVELLSKILEKKIKLKELEKEMDIENLLNEIENMSDDEVMSQLSDFKRNYR